MFTKQELSQMRTAINKIEQTLLSVKGTYRTTPNTETVDKPLRNIVVEKNTANDDLYDATDGGEKLTMNEINDSTDEIY